jgi:hypothetical protein
MNLQTRRDDTGLMPLTAKKLARWGLVMSLCLAGPIFRAATPQSIAAVATEPDTNEKAALRISLKQGAVRGRSGRFEFFDASDGCPEEYVDIPGAKVFFGQTVASDKGATKTLPVGQAIHVLHLGGRGAMRGLVSGGISEQRRRALQVVLTGDAELRVTGFEEFVPLWEASGEIDVAPATDCGNDADSEVEEVPSSDDLREDTSLEESES